MKKLTKIVLIGVTATSLAIGATAFAKRGGDHSERMIERVSDRLELNDNQVQALQALRDEVLETRDLMRGDGNIRTQVNALIAADTFDQGAALSIINDRAASLQANAPELVAAAAVFFDGLDAEQRTEVQEFMDHMGKRHGRHGHWRSNDNE